MGFISQEIKSCCQEAIELQHIEIVISVLNHKICRLSQKKLMIPIILYMNFNINKLIFIDSVLYLSASIWIV